MTHNTQAFMIKLMSARTEGGASAAAKIDCTDASQRLRRVAISPSVTVTLGVVRNRSP